MEKLPVQRNPYLTVDIIIDSGKEIVLVRRKEPVPDLLAVPGGFVEWGEAVEECAVREAKEETGLDVRLKEILGVYSEPSRDPRAHIVTVVFVAEPAGGKLTVSEEHSDVGWHKLDDMDFKNFHGDHAKILKDYIRWKKQKGTYWSAKSSLNK